MLNDAGIGWLDRRGHLRLVTDSLFIDTDIVPASRFRPDDESLRRAKLIGGTDVMSNTGEPSIELAVDPVGLLTHDRSPAKSADFSSSG